MTEEEYLNLANKYFQQQQFTKAIKYFTEALGLNPDSYYIANDLGNVYKQIGDLEKAKYYYQIALKLDPENAGILNNLGVIYLNFGNLNEAKKLLQKAINISPTLAQGYYHLARVYEALENIHLAKLNLEKALKLDPNLTHALAVLVYLLSQGCYWKEYQKGLTELNRITNQDISEGKRPSKTPFFSVIWSPDPEENLRIARAQSLAIKKSVASIDPKFTFKANHSKKKITIGYLSSDFYDHATTHLLLNLFSCHDRSKFNINVYSYGPNNGNQFRKKIETDCDKFCDIGRLSYLDSAKMINKDGVDILIDLKGHTRNTRLEILALKPAPIQVHYLGFPGSIGADFIDYFITDKVVTTQTLAKFFDEKLVYMPNSYQINDNKREIAKINNSKESFGISENAFVFSSFNHTYKIEPGTFKVWMKILKGVPDSILWLLKSNDAAVINLKNSAKEAGVDPSRLIFAEKLPSTSHLARIGVSDLGLDPLICNGHTTTSDSLWSGVPVITLEGKHFASRVSASLLTAVGLPELITHSAKEYERLAVELALNPKKLSAIRKSLILNRKSSALFDTQRFVKDLEKAYLAMWQNYLTGQNPKEIIIK